MGRVADQQPHARARHRVIKRLLLHHQAFGSRSGKFYAESFQQLPVGVTEQPARGRRFGKQPIVRAQQNQVWNTHPGADAVDFAAANPVERHGNRADIVFPQHQRQQPRELAAGHRAAACRPVELLERGQQDFPQLPVLLGELEPPGGFMPRRAPFHRLRHVHPFQERVQRLNARAPRFRLLERLAQTDKGRNRGCAQLVQAFQLGA